MAIGISLLLIAIGAILTWAVNYTVSGVDLNAVGVILMVVGAIGLLMWVIFWSSFMPFRRRETYIDEGGIPHDHVSHDRL